MPITTFKHTLSVMLLNYEISSICMNYSMQPPYPYVVCFKNTGGTNATMISYYPHYCDRCSDIINSPFVPSVRLSWASGGPQPARVQALRWKRYSLPSSKPRSCHWVVSAPVMFVSWESTTSSVVSLTIKERERCQVSS